MRLATLAAAMTLGLGLPAFAYPTALINVPTAGVAPYKGYHVGLYNYLQPSLVPTVNSPYLAMGSVSGGLVPNFDLAPGVSAGALELGVDVFFPFPSSLYPYPSLNALDTLRRDNSPPTLAQPHAKLALLKETDVLPGLALGTYFLSVPSMDFSANMIHLSATKWLSLGDLDLGQYTFSIYHGNPLALEVDSNGWMAGYYRNLPANLYVMADYTSGASRLGGCNVALGYTVNSTLSLTGGYAISSHDRNEDKAFLFLDWIGEAPF